MINLKQLTVFKAINEAGSLKLAGERLGMTPAAVSVNLKMLEEHLGCALIERGRGRRAVAQRVTLTEQGRWLLEKSDTVFSHTQSIENYFKTQQQSDKTLKIGASQTVGNYWLPPYLSELKNGYPGSSVSVYIGNTDDVLSRLERFEDHFAVIEGQSDRKVLESYAFKEDSMTLVAPPEFELGKDLSKYTWLIREPGSATRKMTQYFWQEMGISPSTIIELNTNEAIIHAVAAGAGIAYVPTISTPFMLEAGLLQSYPTFASHTRQLYWVVHKDMQDTPAIKHARRVFFKT
ncbi:LysR family transcriptional regulator [Idiomarina sp. X4]|uniref:LysR family transcriptional regulator n=1 Tax=Idiomarina sp. X4 TaxID=2055892 RepID=UPI000C28697B|nr:LysR family transcriptional regulator [Idiomarina sp. X4]ATZ74143.1 LysR family transcriptional regulator [Idiomarina sp. X4]